MSKRAQLIYNSYLTGLFAVFVILVIVVSSMRGDNKLVDTYVVRHNCTAGPKTPTVGLKTFVCGGKAYAETDVLNMAKKENAK